VPVSFSDTLFLAKAIHGRVEQLLNICMQLSIKRAEVNVAQVLALPVAVQGVVQRDGGHWVDVEVAEGGELQFPLRF
jgi:hypothetical protein